MRWGRRNREDDLERELHTHLDLEAEERGEGPDAARRAFGNLTAVKEAIHEMSNWTVVEQFGQDLRYGARLLRRSPAFSGACCAAVRRSAWSRCSRWPWESGRI